jgi:hypothetical protein
MSAATHFSGSSYSMTVADGQSVRLIRTLMPDLGSTIASPRKGGEIGRRLPAEAKALGSRGASCAAFLHAIDLWSSATCYTYPYFPEVSTLPSLRIRTPSLMVISEVHDRDIPFQSVLVPAGKVFGSPRSPTSTGGEGTTPYGNLTNSFGVGTHFKNAGEYAELNPGGMGWRPRIVSSIQNCLHVGRRQIQPSRYTCGLV